MSSCDDLTFFVDGELEPDRAAAFRDHLTDCGACRAGVLQEMQLSASVTGASPRATASSPSISTSFPAADPATNPDERTPSAADKGTQRESTQPGQELPDVSAATVGMAAVAAFYREVAMVQVRTDALLSALGRRDQIGLETSACEAVATWRLARAALQLVELHAGDDPVQKATAGHALGASRRVLLQFLGYAGETSASWNVDVTRLHETLHRLDIGLRRAGEPGGIPDDRATPDAPVAATEQCHEERRRTAKP